MKLFVQVNDRLLVIDFLLIITFYYQIHAWDAVINDLNETIIKLKYEKEKRISFFHRLMNGKGYYNTREENRASTKKNHLIM